jgi:multiple sugar transport system substrate-binding protein/putative aldouronate transport system substrate-binding protein
MRRNVKLVALFIALVMALSVVAGCAKANPTTIPGITGPLMKEYPEFSTAHTLKVTYFEQGWTGPESDLDVIAPEIAKRTNLTLVYEPMTVPTGDDYTQKLNLMVASGEIPDVFMGGNDAYTRTIYEKLGQAGKIKDLTETLKSYERIYSLVFPESNLYKTAAGKNYFIPTQTGRGNEVLNEPPHGLYVRKDFLDQLKMEYPTTPDELKTYLKRSLAEIKVNGESVLPLVLGENLSGIEQLYEPFFPLIGLQESYSLPFDPKDNFKVKNYEYTNSPELMQAAKYIHSLMAEGLIDSEVLTIKTAQQQEKVSSGLVSAVTTAWWDMNTYSDNAKAAVPDLMFVAAPQIFASKAIQNSRIVDWTNPISCWSSLIISSKVDDVTMKHFLAVLDYLTTKDGQMLVQAGIEGVTYQVNSDGKYEYTDDFKTKTNNLDWNKAAAYGVFYYSQLVFNVPAIRELQTKSPALLREDNLAGWNNRKNYRDHYVATMVPTKDYYFLSGPVEAEKFGAIVDAKLEFWASIIAAKSEGEVETLVNQWAATAKSMGIEEIIAERQAYIDGFKLS